MATEDLGQDLGWEGYVIDDGGNFELLDAGYYPFTVKKLERERFEGSAKMAACSRAKLTLEIVAGDHTVDITDRLMLNTKMQWKISQFFEALGFTKDEEGRMAMHWNEVEEKQGWVKLKVRQYVNKNNEERQSNEVESYIAPAQTNKAYAEWANRYGLNQEQQPVQQQQVVSQPAPMQQPAQTAMPMPQQPQTYINPTTGGSWSL